MKFKKLIIMEERGITFTSDIFLKHTDRFHQSKTSEPEEMFPRAREESRNTK